jgi:hypothetical protein
MVLLTILGCSIILLSGQLWSGWLQRFNLPPNWRIFGPLESIIGVLMCGMSVSLPFAIVTRLITLHDFAPARISKNP